MSTTFSTHPDSVRRRLLVLSSLLLLSLAASAAGPRAARAQLTRVPRVVVLDLVHPAGPSADIMARQATDALVMEMTRTGAYDVLPRPQVVQQMREMGVTAPLDDIAVRKLGQALGTDFVATGTITRLSITEDGDQARATLAVRLTDVASGEAVNGTLASGTARAPEGASLIVAAQATVFRALENAAFRAVQTMNDYQLPEATVLITTFDTVRLNQGSRGGIVIGQEFVIVRGRDRVGRVRVTSVSSNDALAQITDPGKGIRPEDRARAVFTLGPYAAPAR